MLCCYDCNTHVIKPMSNCEFCGKLKISGIPGFVGFTA